MKAYLPLIGCTALVLLTLAPRAGGQTCTSAGPLVNGDFEESPVPGAPPPSWCEDGNVSILGEETDPNHAAYFQEDTAGGRSRIYQSFVLPAEPSVLSFRFRFDRTPPMRTGTVPPDSFSAFLLDSQGERLVLEPTDTPTFSKGFFYTDSDGQTVRDSSHVTVTQTPDSQGLYAAMFDVSSLPASTSARLEFGLASANNGVTSYAILDNVQTGCDLPG